MAPWRERLECRVEKKWDSFSWITLRALISSINHVLNLATPGLVDALRKRWDEENPVEANQRWDGDRVVDRRSASSFLIVGDPGEQDASQYVVVPALLEHKDEGAFVVIMSDVIYPSGDVNDYVDGVYVPYSGLADKPIYALPGNHDWYDGLAGFMWWFCHYDTLPRDAYGMCGGKWYEWPARILWRRPSAPKPRLRLEQRRDVFTPDGALQPGSYFAIDTEHVRLVCIDTGIKGEIDRRQAEWLVKVSSNSDLPKVLLTGKPLWVDNELKCCPISKKEKVACFSSVHEIVRHGSHGYVATIGGDVHNFQDYEIDGMRHVVSGGGGAYTSATHLAVARTEHRSEALYPDAADSLQLFARVLLPKIWRLERAIIATIVGIGLGAAFIALTGGHDELRRDVLLAFAIAVGACVLGRAVVESDATGSRRYRAAALFGALLVGFTVSLSGWWLAPHDYFHGFWGWLGLTVGAGVLAWLMRRTGWWRVRMEGFEIPLGWQLGAASLFVALAGVAWLSDAPWEAVAAALVLGVTALVGWCLRCWTRWKVGAHVAAYSAQLVAALLVLEAWVIPQAAPGPFWGVWGVVLGLLLMLAAIVVLFVVLLPFAKLVAVRRRLRLRAAWGNVGGPGQIVLPVLAGLVVWVEWLILADRDGDARRLAVASLVGLMAPIAAVFGLDWIRRRTSSTAYKPAAMAAVVALVTVALLLDLPSWVPRAAVAVAIGITLGVITVLVAHLVFLGAQWLIVDRDVHADPAKQGPDWLFSRETAWKIVKWRQEGESPPTRWARKRANVAFPLPSQPSGPFQQKVAEFCDTDSPPFRKNFLVVKSDANCLRITPHCVTGKEGEPASTPRETIEVPLGGPGA